MKTYDSVHKANDALHCRKLGDGERCAILGRVYQVRNGRLTVNSNPQKIHRSFDGFIYNRASRGGRARGMK